MNKTISGVSLLLALALTACTSTQPAALSKSPGAQMAQTLHVHRSQQFDLNYLLFLPAGYSNHDHKKWPLMLFLHGAGERGSNIWKVAAHGPPKNVSNNPDFPFILVSPQCPEGRVWSAESLLALLDEIINKFAVDSRRVYLTGLSMGGYGTWMLGTGYPEKFAAIA